MMGHGTPQGLLSVGQFNRKPTPKPSTAIRAKAGGPVTKDHIKDFYTPSTLPAREPGCDDEDDWFSSRQVGSYTPTYKPTYQSYQNYSGYIIDDKTADLLRGKKLTAIWCNADQYIEWNDLGAFYTGMFISETAEATLIGTAGAEQWQVDESNYGFVSVVRRFIDQPDEVLHAALKLEYGKMAEYNPVAKYNYRRLYKRSEEGDVQMEAKKGGNSANATEPARRAGSPVDAGAFKTA